MKVIKPIIMGIALLTMSGMAIAKPEPKKTEKKHTKPKAKAHETKKSTHAKDKKEVATKKTYDSQKVAPHKATTQKAAPTKGAPATTQTTVDKIGQWLGVGGAGTAAVSHASIHHAGYHIGPRDWHHNFPNWWGSRGWTPAVVSGTWYFGGHPLNWWQKEYPTYYKNVILPEYKNSGLYHK